MDEVRPHVHGAVTPVNSEGHLSHKVYFSGAHKLLEMQQIYVQAVEPLGVASNLAINQGRMVRTVYEGH